MIGNAGNLVLVCPAANGHSLKFDWYYVCRLCLFALVFKIAKNADTLDIKDAS